MLTNPPVANIPFGSTWPNTPTLSYVKLNGTIGSPGLAMGPLGCTYSREEIKSTTLGWVAPNGDVKMVELL
jgi:hypothetical protein